MRLSVVFLLSISSASALTLTKPRASLAKGLAARASSAGHDCFKSVPKRHVLTQFGSEYQKDNVERPGAGIGEVTPFENILKDGFVFQDCIKDEMFYHADKYHDHRHSYTNTANVSVVHYSAVIAKMDQKAMTPEVCFDFCRTIPGMLTFGIMNGRECYCEPYYSQMPGDDSLCHLPCDGDNTQMCGGNTKSSIYEMHMCADTAGDLTKGVDKLSKTAAKLGTATSTLLEMSTQGQKEAVEFQQLLGIIGDPTASDNMQAAKVQAGVLQHAAEPGVVLGEQMAWCEEAVSTMLGGSFLQETEGPDFTGYEAAKKAEALVANMTKFTKEAEALLKKFNFLLEFHNKMQTPEGQGMAQDRSTSYYDTYHFVSGEAIGDGKNWEKDKSTCGGDLAADPIFGVSKDQCAYACDSLPHSCQGFNWFSKGAGICFLLSNPTKVTHYDMCAKPLEGQCSPNPVTGEVADSLVQEKEDSHAQSVPFPWKIKSVESNSTLFQESVQGMCTQVYGCSGSAAGVPLDDCSLMDTYKCRATRREAIDELDGGITAMKFTGYLAAGTRSSSCQVNPTPCVKCKKFSTCSGPWMQTEEVEIKKGDVASYTWTSSGAVDNYEVFVGLYSSTCGLVDYQFQRGEQQDWKTFELFAPKTDKYFMKFMLASYDGTGGGAVGADMQVKEVKQTKATVPRVFSVGAKCMLKFSEFEGISMKPDPTGLCKHCLKESNKRCLKPDGTFPIPEAGIDDAAAAGLFMLAGKKPPAH